MTTVVSVRLPDDLAKQLGVIASEADRPKSHIARKALELYLQEDVDLQIALDHLNDPTDPAVSGEKMRRTLGLEEAIPYSSIRRPSSWLCRPA